MKLKPSKREFVETDLKTLLMDASSEITDVRFENNYTGRFIFVNCGSLDYYEDTISEAVVIEMGDTEYGVNVNGDGNWGITQDVIRCLAVLLP